MQKTLLLITGLFIICILQAQDITVSEPVAGGYTPSPDIYRRSALYSVLVKHPEKEFAAEIEEVFHSIPVPDKFDDHNLKIRVINAYIPQKTERKSAEMQKESIEKFLAQNDIGRRMLAKWFNRDNRSGAFNLDLISQRGFYDASVLDIRTARQTVRGMATLADAGEELIGNTFVIVNDIRYVDKEEQADVAAGVFAVLKEIGGIVGSAMGIPFVDTVIGLLGSAVEQITGFKVNITSYLYRLNWTEDIAKIFYDNYWMDNYSPDPVRKAAFDGDKKTFTITYVGSQTVSSGSTTLHGINFKKDEITLRREMIKKVCTRTIDGNIVQLQRQYDEFKIKTPLTGINPITAYIGRKEGVTENSKYEVLEKEEDASGRTVYRRVGTIQPVKGKIWDNRYLSVEEGFEGADLSATEFKKVSGSDFYSGMLIREIR
jgi:hypothetical protein